MYLYLIMIVFKFLPESRLFNFKNFLLRLSGIRIGSNTRICSSVIFHTPNIIIGDGVWIGPGTRFIIPNNSMVYIGNNVDIAMECLFVTGSHSIGNSLRRAGEAIVSDIKVDDGVWVGARTILFGGTVIGESSIIGSASMCKATIRRNCLYAGTPAKLIRNL